MLGTTQTFAMASPMTIYLTCKSISRIAVNVESKIRLKGKDRGQEGGAKPSNGDSSTQHNNQRAKLRGCDRRLQHSGSTGYWGKSQGNGKRNDSGPSGGPRPPSERPSDDFKKNEGYRCFCKMGYFAKECTASEPKCNSIKCSAQGKVKAK